MKHLKTSNLMRKIVIGVVALVIVAWLTIGLAPVKSEAYYVPVTAPVQIQQPYTVTVTVPVEVQLMVRLVSPVYQSTLELG